MRTQPSAAEQPTTGTGRAARRRATTIDVRVMGHATGPTGSRRPRPWRAASGCAGSASTFSRSRRTWTVTVDWSPNVQPHTCSISSARRERLAGVAQQEGEQVELAGGQGELGAVEGRPGGR